MVETARIYLSLIGAQARAQASYRASFWLDMLGNVIFLGADMLTILVIFGKVPALAGFGLAETMVIFGLGASAFSLADLMVGNIEKINDYVRTGLLDIVLIRPLGTLAQLLALDVGYRRLGRLVYSIAIMIVATHYAQVQWTPVRVLLAVITPIVGAVFFSAYFVATSTVAFWWVESRNMANALIYGGREFVSYPMGLFEGWFRRVVAFGLGFGFVAYYPALGLLGRADPLGGPGWLVWCGPLVAALAAGLSTLIWRTAVRHYRSTGS